MVYAVRKRSAMVRSLRELEWREEKGEERGSLDEGGVRAAVSPKEENRRGGLVHRQGRGYAAKYPLVHAGTLPAPCGGK